MRTVISIHKILDFLYCIDDNLVPKRIVSTISAQKLEFHCRISSDVIGE